MMQLLNNRLVRIIGVFIILYLGLFSNKSHKDSLGNRFSGEQLKKDFNDAKHNSVHIVSNIRKAQDLQKNNAFEPSKIKYDLSNFIFKDVIIGKNEAAKCGDQVNIEYRSIIDNKIQKEVKDYNLTIGNNKLDPIIQHYIIGMKEGGIRLIILVNSTQSLNYEVTLKKIQKSDSTESNSQKCDFKNS